ncbi:MAG TPA: hypothetical protein DCY48_00145 [Candidatus Magasanikbacteria bacterium]|nr:MAG: hypothetical protein A3I74_04830 [Candidatus Magasanikbacteria bacterium RIFCSPLOWO2_02_FULL_47_16]OGH79737.1 MAG: hypothetical protein A3C10_03980 [Candidatus Magasanikbacteria bacterium RIFCSPHIGHO2_02_FULL_48_18]OGH82285.1 MAG: hypothetical protein A3G08_03330 [Candidatus Magasanikbacteria bacterium RIFCSPLOWO2_12_FULL_47_9b]HAZ28177.1 hypothetical protein [Candidatus Magasanikbacteria bacterium]
MGSTAPWGGSVGNVWRVFPLPGRRSLPILKGIMPQKSRLKDTFPCHPYEKNPGILVCWHDAMGDLAKDEAHHHDDDDADQFETHQLNAWRNLFYHKQFQSIIQSAVPKGSPLLEIGAGSGVDAKVLVQDHPLTITDVSPATLDRLSQWLRGPDIFFIAADGQFLPFEDHQFGAVYMAATFHHFEDPQKATAECYRVLRKDGIIAIAVEPNATYFRPLKRFQNVLYRLTHTDPEHISHADAEMEGFRKSDFEHIFDSDQWTDRRIRPMWFVAGWIHYFLEFLFRAFRLKKRIILPLWLEKGIVAFDEVFFRIPGMKYFCWHWIVSAKKR